MKEKLFDITLFENSAKTTEHELLVFRGHTKSIIGYSDIVKFVILNVCN